MNKIANCCSGHVNHVDTVAGVEETIAGYHCYVAKPATASTKTVVIATDVFGYKLPNVRLIADNFAKHGFNVFIPNTLNEPVFPLNLPDLLHGLNEKESGELQTKVFMDFLGTNPMSQTVERTTQFITELKKAGSEHVSIVGYCWGGGVAVNLSKTPGFLNGIVANHPSLLNYPTDIESITCPACFVIPETDMMTSKEQALEIKTILERDSNANKAKNVYKFYEGVSHGFAVRGDSSDAVVGEKTRDAFQVAVAFLNQI